MTGNAAPATRLTGQNVRVFGIADATRKQEHSAFYRALLLPAVAVGVAASALGSRLGSRDGESAGIAAPLPVDTMSP